VVKNELGNRHSLNSHWGPSYCTSQVVVKYNAHDQFTTNLGYADVWGFIVSGVNVLESHATGFAQWIIAVGQFLDSQASPAVVLNTLASKRLKISNYSQPLQDRHNVSIVVHSRLPCGTPGTIATRMRRDVLDIPPFLRKMSAKSIRQFQRKCVPYRQTDRQTHTHTEWQTGSKLNIPD